MVRENRDGHHSFGSLVSFGISEWSSEYPLVDSMYSERSQLSRTMSIAPYTETLRNSALAVLIAAGLAAPVHGVEVLPARELASHCQDLARSADSAGAQFCTHYVQGFIDGAVSTDVRVMMNMEAEYEQRRSLTERAIQTRMPGWHDQQRAAGYAEFCLGDPLPLAEVVLTVAGQLEAQAETMDPELAARDAVYAALREHYPC